MSLNIDKYDTILFKINYKMFNLVSNTDFYIQSCYEILFNRIYLTKFC